MIPRALIPLSTKIEMRHIFAKQRKNLSSSVRQRAEKEAFKSLHNISKLHKHVLSYASFKDELDCWQLNNQLASQKRLVLPRVEKDSLTLYLVTDIDSQLKKSRWGILEPIPEKCTRIPLSLITLAIVPGLAFDQNHHRLGYGKGFYDRLLSDSHQNIKTIGIGFREQFSEEPLPHDTFDIPLKETLLF